MKRLLMLMFDRFCGQPDLLKNSRSRALKEMLAIPVPKPKRSEVPIGEEIEA